MSVFSQFVHVSMLQYLYSIILPVLTGTSGRSSCLVSVITVITDHTIIVSQEASATCTVTVVFDFFYLLDVMMTKIVNKTAQPRNRNVLIHIGLTESVIVVL